MDISARPHGHVEPRTPKGARETSVMNANLSHASFQKFSVN